MVKAIEAFEKRYSETNATIFQVPRIATAEKKNTLLKSGIDLCKDALHIFASPEKLTILEEYFKVKMNAGCAHFAIPFTILSKHIHQNDPLYVEPYPRIIERSMNSYESCVCSRIKDLVELIPEDLNLIGGDNVENI